MRLVLSLVLICASTVAAAADGLYVSEAIGGTDVQDELGAQMDGAMRIRFGVGYRQRGWALEGWFAGALGANGAYHGEPVPATCTPKGCGGVSYGGVEDASGLFTYGLDLKYLRPLTPQIDGYLRGGLSYGAADNGYAGRGLGLGAGAQLKGKVPALGFLFWPLFFTGWGPKVTAAVYAETGYEFYRLHRGGDRDAGASIDAQLHHLTVGFAVGSDF